MRINKNKLKKVLIVLALGVAYYIIISITPFSLKCPVYTVSRHHVKCPGCGITHACMEALNLDIRSAFYYHPIAVVFAPFWLVCGVLWLFDRGERFNMVVSRITLPVLLVFFIARNIPGFPLY